jgi:hypothetical protein
MNTNAAPVNGPRMAWWVIGTVATVCISAVTGALATLRNNSERIAVLESQINDTRIHLRNIEAKLDNLIDRRRH